MNNGIDLKTTYLHLTPGAEAVPLPVTETFWAELAEGRPVIDGWLYGVYAMAAGPWPHWERHPHGAEILTLLSGKMELTLEETDGPRVVAMTAGDTVIVPQGVWHIGRVIVAGDLMALTFGKGTEHRPVS